MDALLDNLHVQASMSEFLKFQLERKNYVIVNLWKFVKTIHMGSQYAMIRSRTRTKTLETEQYTKSFESAFLLYSDAMLASTYKDCPSLPKASDIFCTTLVQMRQHHTYRVVG
jgi:hypothetical protein